ncbi:MAG: bifunctional diaminohydroxyphosphoribosylaminopyrimidine deaminase/5-amino-6-(5-phosphoribosylamino)uracil reductase RibD [Candidatus Acidiferrales bacterium]
MNVNAADEKWMSRALDLAIQGVALAHPNPIVGAVLVKNNRIVAEGFHAYDRRDHAEIVALKNAGKKARGATLYVTLEPCCITGRTGPCTKAIIAAGVKRVVAAMRDPNPAVSGKGFAALKRAGIAVRSSVLENFAHRYNEDFARWIKTKRPLVTLKTALTLDGQIAQKPGRETQITGEQSRYAVQHLRHEADAILTGIGTILADNPRLTDCSGEPRRRKLLRAIVDTHLRTPLRSKIVKSAKNDVVIFTTQSPTSPKARALQRAGVEVFRVPAHRSRVDLHAVVRELGKREILNVLLESGAELNGAALEAGIVDKMILFYAPKIMGTGGVPLASIPSSWFAKSPALQNLNYAKSGPDFVVTGYFHDVYRHHRTSRKN